MKKYNLYIKKKIKRPKVIQKDRYEAFNKIIGIAKFGDPKAYEKIDEIYLRD